MPVKHPSCDTYHAYIHYVRSINANITYTQLPIAYYTYTTKHMACHHAALRQKFVYVDN